MNARMEFSDFKQLAPAAADALSALSNSVVDSGLANLDKQLIELLKIRASQLNGCAFCVQCHLNLAAK
jgi:alkylhydroperoxidase family enzyme